MQKKLFIKITQDQHGSMLVVVLVATGLFLIMAMGAIELGLLQQKLNIRKVARAQALHIAEAGVNYYRWVLYHDPKEYCNKETCIGAPDYGPYGPYTYTDSAGQNIDGYYELYIIPPALNGSTIVTIKSIGWVADYSNIKRTIEVQCGIPSWSSYSTLANSHMRFGGGTETWGPIHSNGGIRFDGVAHNIITSALLDYDDPDHGGANEFGVHTHVAPVDPLPDGNNPPENVPSRPDVFIAGRSFPMLVVSFDLLDNYVTETLTKAEENGLVLDNSGDEGYHITLNINDTIDIRKVNLITPQCRYKNGSWKKSDTDGIVNETDYIIGTSTPPNGIVFIKDNVWVDGQINGNRITILAFEEPLGGNKTDIIINNDLMYTNYDGTDAIGLIAQRNISVGLFSEDNLQIDAALIAKEGRIGRNYFPCTDDNDCSATYCIRDTITINGSLATRNRYGFAWTDGTGYQTRNLNYDNNLTFIPPPHFPTTGEYSFISWNE
jgi:hypothetical protein